MLQIKMISRSWSRVKLNTFISVVSLTVGLACSALLILFVLGEYRISQAPGNTDRVYLLETTVAYVVAIPIAYYFSAEWLSTFVCRVDVALWVFVATAGIAAAITFLTVIFQTWIAASANPAKSIKTE